MSKTKTLIKHFAVIADLEWQSDEFRYSLQQVDPIHPNEDIKPDDTRPISRCGKYRYWQSNRLIVSDVIEISAEYDEVTDEAEVEYLNNEIRYQRKKSLDELEKKLDPLKARLTALLAITHQPE